MTDEILKRLDALSAKLGVAAGHLWEILVRQARVDAFENVLLCILSLCGVCVFVRLASWVLKKADEEWAAFAFGCACVGAVACSIASLVGFCSLWTPLLNPEYFAFQKIVEAFK